MTEGATDTDLLDQAIALIDVASERDIPLRLLGGLAIRLLCRDLPPRRRTGQDLDFASSSSHRRLLDHFLIERAFVPDKNFNALYGNKQLYYTHSESGLALDVLIDKLEMSHTLVFADRLTRMPYTLDPLDLLLSKLQIVELNEKDADDALQLLVTFPLADSEEPAVMNLRVFRQLVGEDWGWWRTVTLNLDRIRDLVASSNGERPAIRGGRLNPNEQLSALADAAETAPKTRRWRMRARIGERKRWYEIPEETAHQ